MLKDLYFDSKILGGGLVRHELCLIFFYTGVYNLDVSLFYCGKVMFAVFFYFLTDCKYQQLINMINLRIRLIQSVII